MKVLVEGLTHAAILEKNSLGEKHSSLVVVSLLGFLSFRGLVVVNKSFPVSIMVPPVPGSTILGLSAVDIIVVVILGLKQGLEVDAEGILVGVVPEAADVFDIAVPTAKFNEEISVGDGSGTPWNLEGPGGVGQGVFCAISCNRLSPRIGIDFPKVIVP